MMQAWYYWSKYTSWFISKTVFCVRNSKTRISLRWCQRWSATQVYLTQPVLSVQDSKHGKHTAIDSEKEKTFTWIQNVYESSQLYQMCSCGNAPVEVSTQSTYRAEQDLAPKTKMKAFAIHMKLSRSCLLSPFMFLSLSTEECRAIAC
jgi:hypothetical protein